MSTTAAASAAPAASPRAAAGAQRWAVLGLALLLQMVSTGALQTSFTFFVGPWTAAFHAPRTQVVGLISIQIAVTGLVSILAGRWLDALPPRPLVMAGLGALAANAVVVASAPNLLVITASFASLTPLAAALAGPLAAVTLVARTFRETRGTAIGVASLGVSLAGLVFPFAAAALLRGGDWRTAYFALTFAPALLLAPLAWIVLSPMAVPAPSGTGGKGRKVAWAELMRRRDFWVLVFCFQSVLVAGAGLNHNLRPIASDLRISVEATAFVIACMSTCSFLGKVIMGVLSDRVDNRLLFLGAAGLMAGAAGLMMYATDYSGLIVACGMLGLALGGFLPLRGALFAASFGPEQIGRALGLAAPFAIVTASGPVIAARLRDQSGSYGLAFIAVITLLALAAPTILLLPRALRASRPAP